MIGGRKSKWILVFPAIIFVLAWNVFPLFWALGLSFYDFSIVKGGTPRFVGLSNFAKIFSEPYYWERFQTTVIYTFSAVFFEFMLGLVLGFLFFEEFGGKRVMLTVMMAPMVIAPVAVGLFWRFMYEPTWGIFDYVLFSLFKFRIGFLVDSKWALPSVILVDIWTWSPFMVMMTLAGLQSVPVSMLEAAEIDRVPWWMKFRYVILPTLRPLLILALLLRTIDAFRIFDTIFVMTKGGPGTATEVISMTVYRVAFAFFKTGLGSAIAILLLIISIVLTSIYLRVLRGMEA